MGLVFLKRRKMRNRKVKIDRNTLNKRIRLTLSPIISYLDVEMPKSIKKGERRLIDAVVLYILLPD
nr:hypothetical protein [Leptospira santarosai]